MGKGFLKNRENLRKAREKVDAGKFTSASSYSSSSSSNSSGSSSGTASSCSSSSSETFRSTGTNTATTSCDVGTMTDMDVATQDAATMTSVNTVCVATMTEPIGDDDRNNDGAELQRNTEGANGDELQVSATNNIQTTLSLRGKDNSLVVKTGDNSCRVYRLTHSHGQKRYYRCSKCETINKTARNIKRPKITTTAGQITSNPHPEHHMECTPFTLEELDAREIDLKCRQEVRAGITEPRFAWSRGHSLALNNSTDTAVMFPAWESVRKSYSRCRLHSVTAISDPFNLPPCYTTSRNARWLLVADSEHGVVAFSSDRELRTAAASDILVADATFSIAPRDFYQILTVHCRVWNDTGYEWVPFLHAAMKNKMKESYSIIFGAMIRQWQTMGCRLSFRVVQTDFEEAIMSAVSDNFGAEAVKGCLFHYNQAVLRNVRKFGLTSAYNERGVIHQWIRRILALPLLPEGHVRCAWEMELKNPPQPPSNWVPPPTSTSWPSRELLMFSTYFERFWMSMSLSRWNCYKLKNRTTNAAESYHSVLSRQLRAPRRPTFSTYLTFLQKRHLEYLTRIGQLEQGARTRRRNTRYVKVDNALMRYMQRYEVRLSVLRPATPLAVWYEIMPYLDRVQYLLADVDRSGLRSRKEARARTEDRS